MAVYPLSTDDPTHPPRQHRQRIEVKGQGRADHQSADGRGTPVSLSAIAKSARTLLLGRRELQESAVARLGPFAPQ